MSSDANGRLVKTGMIVHQEEESSMWWLQQLETTADRQLTVRKMGRAVNMMSMSEVGDGQEGWRHEPTGLSMVAQAHANIYPLQIDKCWVLKLSSVLQKQCMTRSHITWIKSQENHLSESVIPQSEVHAERDSTPWADLSKHTLHAMTCYIGVMTVLAQDNQHAINTTWLQWTQHA